MRYRMLLTIPAAALAATCAYNPPPAPISGDPETLGFLAGEWSGTYQSEDTGREGDIYFRLRAGADTARGEVLMAPRYDLYLYSLSPSELTVSLSKPPPVVTINFVRGSGPWVYGALDEYRDPESGIMLNTTFTGRIVRDRIEGQFRATPQGSALTDLGTWSVRRTGPPPQEPAVLVELDARAARAPGDTVGLPGLQGPTTEEMVAQGRALFRDLGCAYCHGPQGRSRIAPDLAQSLPHRSFSWIYRMMINPDSMVRNDPIAKSMYEEYGFKMPNRGVSPWDALVLYEFLLAEVVNEPPPDPMESGSTRQ
jgi:hypothetical protein